MTKKDYSKTITANIAANEALRRISRVSGWWTKNFKGASQKRGDIFSVDFGETFVDFKVVEVIPEKRIVWEVTNCNLHWIRDKTEWNNTRIVWDISTANKTTTVRMTHVGLTPAAECYSNCKKGWDFHVGESLLELLTENKGLAG